MMPYSQFNTTHISDHQQHMAVFRKQLQDNLNQTLSRRTRGMNRVAQFDNDGRRSGADRRQFSYAVYIPERRMEDNRRLMTDRRHKSRH